MEDRKISMPVPLAFPPEAANLSVETDSSFDTPAERVGKTVRGKNLDNNPIFSLLVKSDEDVIGLVAYALYKQSKRDWMIAFTNEHKRPPNEAELNAFIVGERTERRIVTYRRLAEDVLGHFYGKGTSTKALMAHRKDTTAPLASSAVVTSPLASHVVEPTEQQETLLERIGTKAKIAAFGIGVVAILYFVGSRLLGR